MQVKHFHHNMEIYFLLEGERYYFINNRTYQIKKGDLVLINKNILHILEKEKTIIINLSLVKFNHL
ncbi:MAG: cupin domain-containing protein [bacterium]